jgi:hypothetical protein
VDFEIPPEFSSLWRYMYHMYQLDAFTQSCPADQDIINHYKLQQVRLNLHAIFIRQLIFERLCFPAFKFYEYFVKKRNWKVSKPLCAFVSSSHHVQTHSH